MIIRSDGKAELNVKQRKNSHNSIFEIYVKAAVTAEWRGENLEVGTRIRSHCWPTGERQ